MYKEYRYLLNNYLSLEIHKAALLRATSYIFDNTILSYNKGKSKFGIIL